MRVNSRNKMNEWRKTKGRGNDEVKKHWSVTVTLSCLDHFWREWLSFIDSAWRKKKRTCIHICVLNSLNIIRDKNQKELSELFRYPYIKRTMWLAYQNNKFCFWGKEINVWFFLSIYLFCKIQQTLLLHFLPAYIDALLRQYKL